MLSGEACSSLVSLLLYESPHTSFSCACHCSFFLPRSTMCGLPAKYFQADDLTGVVRVIPGLKLPACSVSSTASIASFFASIGTLTRTLQVRLGSPLLERCARIWTTSTLKTLTLPWCCLCILAANRRVTLITPATTSTYLVTYAPPPVSRSKSACEKYIVICRGNLPAHASLAHISLCLFNGL